MPFANGLRVGLERASTACLYVLKSFLNTGERFSSIGERSDGSNQELFFGTVFAPLHFSLDEPLQLGGQSP
jgi:hypothetical protein